MAAFCHLVIFEACDLSEDQPALRFLEEISLVASLDRAASVSWEASEE